MLYKLKIKKMSKLYIQKFIRHSILAYKNKTKILNILIKNKNINYNNKYFCWLKKRNIYYNSFINTNIWKKKIKSICPIYGKTFISKKYGIGRFFMHNLLQKGNMSNHRGY